MHHKFSARNFAVTSDWENEKKDADSDGAARSFFRSKDPLVILGIIILAIGLVLFLYGFVPALSPQYQNIGQPVNVPINDTSGGQFVTPAQAQVIAAGMFNGTAPDRIVCYPSTAGYTCYGQQLIGTFTTTSNPAKEYGGGMIALGFVSFYLGYRYEPLMIKKKKKQEEEKEEKERPKERRSFRIIIDEDICIANSVCVNLAPKVFQLKKQESPSLMAPLAYVVDPHGASNDEILVAAQMCPTGAIIIEDEETGERIHPPPKQSYSS